MVNATEKKDIPTRVSNEKEIVKTSSNKIEKVSKDDAFFGCGSEGNGYYSMLRSEGMSHREARTARRAFVRNCRGGGWRWVVGVWTFGTVGL